jgi:hypothetical protein
LKADGERPIPDIPAALAIRAQNPARAEKYTAALTGENVEYLDPKVHAKIGSAKQIAAYLSREAGAIPRSAARRRQGRL